MIRIYVLVGTFGVLAVAYLTVFQLGPVAQLPPPESLVTGFREEGFVPQSVDLYEDEAVEHEIFGVPPEDEAELARAMAAMGDMAGMDMSGTQEETMKMPDGSTMKMPGDASGQATEGTTMQMAEGATAEMAEGGMAMKTEEGEAPHDEEAEQEAPHAEGKAAGGLLITAEGDFDREIDLVMTEWGFSDMNIEVKKGERIRFNVTNDGEILHEFMVMQGVQMQGVLYRVERADWSLLEHEALYEKSLMLPSQKISFVLEVRENGAWMFMCMLPFHMQLGMMGQMATPGMAMEM